MSYDPIATDSPVYATHGLTAANLRNTRAALARLKNNTGDFTIAGQGDSIFANGGSGNEITDNVIRYTAKNIATKLGVTARHAMIPYSTNGTVRSEWSALGTGWATFSGFQFLGGSHVALQCPGGSTGAVTFTPMDDSGAQINVDSFVVYLNYQSSGIQAAIDGGSYSNVANSNASNTDAFNRITISAGSRGLHTLSLKAQGSGTVYLMGISGEDSTTHSVRYITGGLSGTGVPSQEKADMRCLFPDLTVYEWGTNDEAGQTALATFLANVALVAAKPMLWARPSDCLWAGWPPRQTQGSPLNDASYYAALDAAADAAGIPVLHLDRIVKSYTVGNASPLQVYNDGIHPNAAGRQLWGSTLAGLLDAF